MKHLEPIDMSDSSTVRLKVALPSVVFVCRAESKCPFCDQHGPWRRGVGFDHERRCEPCDVTWEPGEWYLAVTSLEGK